MSVSASTRGSGRHRGHDMGCGRLGGNVNNFIGIIGGHGNRKSSNKRTFGEGYFCAYNSYWAKVLTC